MPIKFRCAYCQKLLAITRRKAGTVIKCPKCFGEVMVPNVAGNDDDDADIDVSEPAKEPPKAKPMPPPTHSEKVKSSPSVPTQPEKENKKIHVSKPVGAPVAAREDKQGPPAIPIQESPAGIPSSAVIGLGVTAFFLIFVALVTGLLFGRLWGLHEAAGAQQVQAEQRNS